MNTNFKQYVTQKVQLIQPIQDKTVEEKTYEETFLEAVFLYGDVVYTPVGFNLERFLARLKIFLQNDLGFETETNALSEKFYHIIYSKAKGLVGKIGLSESFQIFIHEDEGRIIVLIETASDNERSFAVNFLTKMSNSSEAGKILQFIETDFLSFETESQPIDLANCFIEEISVNNRLWLQAVLEPEETVLSFLAVEEIKGTENFESTDSVSSAYFIWTTNTSALVGFDKQNEVVFFEQVESGIEQSSGIMRDTFSSNKLKWTNKRGNAGLFKQILEFQTLRAEDSLIACARLNFLEGRQQAAIALLENRLSRGADAFSEFLLHYIKFTLDNSSIGASENALSQICNTPDFGEKFFALVQEWHMPEADKAMIADIMVHFAETPEQKKNFHPFYAHVREDFLKRTKDIFSLTIFDLVFSRYLVEAGLKDDAVKIIEKRLGNLPDESLSDLLPAGNTNVVGSESGQLLKVKLLDLLVEANHDTINNIAKLAELQPLNIERLEALAKLKTGIKSERAQELIDVLTQIPVESAVVNLPETVNPINNKKTAHLLRHPSTDKKGSFYSVQKWLSKLKEEDYSAVKSFSERLDASQFPEVFNIVNRLKHAFSMPDLDVFLARGEKRKQIIAYHGTPPFLIIGFDYVQNDSEYYLNSAELQFVIASELSHLMFNHTRITSTDVWRGAADKGYLFLDTVLTIIPMAGLVGKALQNSERLTKIGDMLKISDKFSKTGDFFGSAVSVASFYKKVFPKAGDSEKKQKLLVASRLMQYTSDRAGILFGAKLSAAVKTLFFTHENYRSYWSDLQTKSLIDFLLELETDNDFRHQDIALRLAAIASFYISDDFESLTKAVYGDAKNKST